MKPYFAKYLPIDTEIEEVYYCIQCSMLGGGIRHCAHPEECGNITNEIRPKLNKGDIIIDNNLGTCIVRERASKSTWVEWKGGTTNLVITPKHKKAKLFLCSRDTQPNDLVLLSARVDPIPKKLHPDDFERGKHLGCFKIIGEISPDAKWVKEGDEFDEEDIQYQTHLYVEGFDDDEETYFDNKYKDFRHTIGLKGPCGHFH